jgi:hypothetical protein
MVSITNLKGTNITSTSRILASDSNTLTITFKAEEFTETSFSKALLFSGSVFLVFLSFFMF